MNVIKDFQEEFRRRGWTQTQWAEATGIPQSTISRILNEEGSPRLDTVEPLLPFLYPSHPAPDTPQPPDAA